MAQRTLIIIKPDGVQRGLVGAILGRFEQRGLKLVGLKLMSVTRSLAEVHYAVHKEKPFFADLIEFITAAPVVCAVAEGPEAIAVVRSLVGATRFTEAAPGSIRGDFALDLTMNLSTRFRCPRHRGKRNRPFLPTGGLSGLYAGRRSLGNERGINQERNSRSNAQ